MGASIAYIRADQLPWHDSLARSGGKCSYRSARRPTRVFRRDELGPIQGQVGSETVEATRCPSLIISSLMAYRRGPYATPHGEGLSYSIECGRHDDVPIRHDHARDYAYHG